MDKVAVNRADLIERAAKATGEQVKDSWDPLMDDGDALRLAVKLNIRHFRRGDHICAHVYWRDDIIADVIKVAEKIDMDAYGATRRAIVRAAAELYLMQPRAGYP